MTTAEKLEHPNKKPSPLNSFVATLSKKILFGLGILFVIIYVSHLGLDMSQGAPLKSAAVNAVSKTISSLNNIVSGELGSTRAATNTLRSRPVEDVIKEGLVKSLGLLSVSMMVATIFGVGLGLIAAVWRQGKASLPILLLTITGVSLPSFLIALLFQMGVIQISQITGTRFLPVGGFGWDKRLVLPALVLAARPLAQITRVTFVTISNILKKDYIRTAYSKGIRERRVILFHVTKNSLIPILTTISTSIRFSLSSLPIVETFFGWGGIGFLLLGAISQQDANLTVPLVAILGLIFILINIILDLIYPLIDPRLRTTPDHIESRPKLSLFFWISSLVTDIWNLFSNNQLIRWLGNKRKPKLKSAKIQEEHIEDQLDYRARERRLWFNGTFRNYSFMAGSIMVLFILFAFLFGSEISPYSPYTTRGTEFIDGKFSVPPFSPGEEYPWGTDMLGRDMMSLILAGTQQTMVLATLVVLARLALGFITGAISGWFNGSWIDRFLLGAVETISAFPALLLSMMLILAFGIREGIPPFVIALGFVGWGEIMQFVRAEVLSIRPKLFIESAVAVGQRSSRIVFKHILPNLVPALISITALEMGAVLMLLGELGFIGIFIGGGAFAQFEMFRPFFHYSDVPEWGALLANIRMYSRSYPWTALYPATAFFVAILGFNLLGEGIRRMMDIVGVRITKIFNKYTAAALVIFFTGFFYVKGATGATAVYINQASQFQGGSAYSYLEELTGDALKGRSLSTGGIDLTADYIADQFKQFGVQPAGEQLSYFQTSFREYMEIKAAPSLSISSINAPMIYKKDFMEYQEAIPIDDVTVTGLTKIVIIKDVTRAGFSFPALDRLNFSDNIILLLSERELSFLRRVPHSGVLVLADQDEPFSRNQTPLPLLRTNFSNLQFTLISGPPTYWVKPNIFEQVLEGSGYTIEDLRGIEASMEPNEVFTADINTNVTMELKTEHHKRVPVRHVLGFIPGSAAIPGAAKMDNQLIVIAAQYDTPALSWEGVPTPYALDNASGVALMLETIRILQETEYQPYRTIYFAAYAGEGIEGGAQFVPKISEFLAARIGFSNAYNPIALIELRGIGAQEANGVVIRPGSSLRLTQVFEKAAQLLSIESKRQREELDLGIIFSPPSNLAFRDIGEEAPQLGFSMSGWEIYSHLPGDNLENISESNLEEAGKVLSLALMIMARDFEY